MVAAAAAPKIAWYPQEGPQTWLLNCPVEDIFFGGARGGGKTSSLLGYWLAHWGRYGQHAQGVIFRRTFPQLEEIKKQSALIFPKVGGTYNKTERTWHFPNGATLKLRFLDSDADADNYQGHEYTMIGVDEAGNFPTSGPIDMLRACLRSTGPGVKCVMLLTGNPGGVGHEWLKKRYVTPSRPLKPFYDEAARTWRVYIPSRVEDNKILMAAQPGYRDRIRGSGAPWLVKAWLDGDWSGQPTGRILRPEMMVEVARDPFDLCRQLHLRPTWYWDFAVTEKQTQKDDPDYTAGLLCARDELNRFWILDAWRGQVEPETAARMVLTLQKKWEKFGVQVKGESGVIEKCMAPIMRLVGRETGHFVYIQPLKKGAIDKVQHSVPYQNLLSSGQVHVIAGAPWLADLKHEHATFPVQGAGIHDDWIDDCSYAAADLEGTPLPSPTKGQEPDRFHPSMTADQVMSLRDRERKRDEEEDQDLWS